MTMIIKYFCNRCNKEMLREDDGNRKFYQRFFNLTDYDSINNDYLCGHKLNICRSCFNEFNKWWKSK